MADSPLSEPRDTEVVSKTSKTSTDTQRSDAEHEHRTSMETRRSDGEQDHSFLVNQSNFEEMEERLLKLLDTFKAGELTAFNENYSLDKLKVGWIAGYNVYPRGSFYPH